MSRLPIPGSDQGTWGEILNDFLSVEHNASGVLKDVVRSTDSRLTDTRTPKTHKSTHVSGGSDALSASDINAMAKGELALNVKDYGAVGNGVTDDRAAIVACLAAVPATGAIVWFPAGTYLVNSAITVVSNVIMQGAGMEVSVFTCTTSITSMFVSGSVSLTNVTFRDLGWSGGAVDDGSYPRRNRTINNSFAHAVEFDGSLVPSETSNPLVKDIRFERCKVINCASLPVFFRGVSGVIKVTDSYFYNCMDPGFIFCESVVVSRNRAVKGADNGFSISRGCTNVVVTDNTIDQCAHWGIWVAGFVISNSSSYPSYQGPSNYVVTGNVITNAGYGGITLGDGSQNGVISNNVVNGAMRGSLDEQNDGVGVGINVSSFPSSDKANPVIYASNLVISNNNLLNCARGGIYIQGLNQGKIHDNLIVNAGSQYMADGATPVSNASQTQNFGIVIDPGYVATSSSIDVVDNTVIDNRSTPYTYWSVYSSTSVANLNIRGNKVIGVTHQGTPTDTAQTHNALITATGGLRGGASTATVSTAFARVDGASGNDRRLVLGTGLSSDRWAWAANSTVESGSNVGSDLELRAYNDSGAALWTPQTITRSSGLITFSRAWRPGKTDTSLVGNGAVTLDANTGNIFNVTLAANATSSSITNANTGMEVTISWIQDGTGSRTYSWPSNIVWANGSSPSNLAVPNARDTVRLYYDGSNWNEISRSRPDVDLGAALPSDHGLKAWAFDPITSSATFTPTAGVLYLMSLYIRGWPIKVSNIFIYVGTAGTGVQSLANCYLGVYDVTGNLLAGSSDQSASWATTGGKQISITSQNLSAGTKYFVGLLVGTQSTTNVGFRSGNTSGITIINQTASNLRSGSILTGQTTLPSSFTASSMSGTPTMWAGLT